MSETLDRMDGLPAAGPHGRLAPSRRRGLEPPPFTSSPASTELLEWAATLPLRLRDKIDIDPAGCWLFTGAVADHGYGVIWRFDRNGTTTAHRVVYMLRHPEASIEGLHLDHLCRERRCVRPDHLEAVEVAENIRRGLAGNEASGVCRAGLHPWTEGNTYTNPASDFKSCRKCRAQHRKAYRERTGK